MSTSKKLAGQVPDYTVPKLITRDGFVHQAMMSGGDVVLDSASSVRNQSLLHESAGEGITVFIMDMGFDVDNDTVKQELRFPSSPPQPTSRPPPNQRTNHFITPLSTFLGTDIPSSILSDPNHDSHFRDTLPTDIHAANSQRSQSVRVATPRLPALGNPDGLDPSHGHGTQLASLALGTKYGIAPKARLYPVKVGSCLWNTRPTHSSSSHSSSRGQGQCQGQSGGVGSASATEKGEWQHHLEPARWQPWDAAFAHIIRVIVEGKLQGKAVVLCSTGHERVRLQGWRIHTGTTNGRDEQVERSEGSDKLEQRWIRVFRKRIQDLADLGVAFVCSAGNNGRRGAGGGEDGVEKIRHVGDLIPGCLADDTSCRTPICVGAVDEYGRLCGDTSLEGSWEADGEYDAKVTLWAMGERVRCMGYGGVEGEVDGTSYSAAIVAGLIAYILGHPSSLKDPALEWNGDPNRGFVVLNRLRQILLELSYQ